jgi:hypothetical protein
MLGIRCTAYRNVAMTRLEHQPLSDIVYEHKYTPKYRCRSRPENIDAETKRGARIAALLATGHVSTCAPPCSVSAAMPSWPAPRIAYQHPYPGIILARALLLVWFRRASRTRLFGRWFRRRLASQQGQARACVDLRKPIQFPERYP